MLVRKHSCNGSVTEADVPDQYEGPRPLRVVSDELEIDNCKSDSTIMTLINQTRTEWVAWAGNNFPSLTVAERTRLGVLFWVVAVGVRRSVR